MSLTVHSSTQPLVTIEMGGSRSKRMMIQRNVLVPRSKFFTNFLGDSLFISLPERFGESVDALECYLEYMNSGKIASTIRSTRKTFNARGEEEYALLCKTYLFADVVEEDGCKDAIMSALLAVYQETEEDGCHRRPSADLVKMMYASTSPGSPLRKFLVDAFIWHNASAMTHARNGQIPDDLVEFFSDVLNTLLLQNAAARHDAGIPSGVRCCDYHVHEDPAMCTTKKRKRAIADVGMAAIQETAHQDDQQALTMTTNTIMPAPTPAATQLTSSQPQSSPAPLARLDTAQPASSSTPAPEHPKPTLFFTRHHSQPLFGQISSPTQTVKAVDSTASQPPAGTGFGQTTDSNAGTGFARFESPAHLPPSWQR
ncbi:hypothetical protein BDY17DRAFT_172164 [Neohortaea acidophila]|uniref:BTB domain-containing protein n=1 Tax=Neohortaea acidophila TaxID=245834 RepID=A0A6A6PQB6_9PEZI|nr:uncharacterized protein BDY17DRAFT_172164 [Neohortaea acidophila]KAF2481824.1 hypothetical protein BDY17DRAFT_172164 [Neohortaea acidophila]